MSSCLPEPSLLNDVLSNKISCGGSYYCLFVSFRRIRVCSEQQLERSERRQNLVSLDHLVTYTPVWNVLL